MARQNDGGSAALKYFGSQLQLLRTRSGLTQAELGERFGYSESTVASVEQGRRVPQEEFIERADEVLGANGLLKAGAPFVAQARYPAFFQDFVKREAEAVSRHAYENQLIPGLLQTEDYARALLSAHCPPLDDETLERRLRARLERQSLLDRSTFILGFVIEEVALRRPVGGPAVLKAQLQRILERGELRNVSIQVMPTASEAHMGLNGPMVLLETRERQHLAYVEGQAGSHLLSDREEVSVLGQRYGIIRALALSPRESARLIEQVAGEL